MSHHQITVVIPTIAPRVERLLTAVASVARQTHPAHAISIATDVDRQGAPATRDRALAAVNTEWVAFLDDDDELYPHHLAALAEHQAATGADLVFPWYDVIGGTDPHAVHEGEPWDPEHPHQVPVTFLARTEMIRAAGGFDLFNPEADSEPGLEDGHRAGEDLRLILRLNRAGKHIAHLPARTWAWHHWTDGNRIGNTSGLPTRW